MVRELFLPVFFLDVAGFLLVFLVDFLDVDVVRLALLETFLVLAFFFAMIHIAQYDYIKMIYHSVVARCSGYGSTVVAIGLDKLFLRQSLCSAVSVLGKALRLQLPVQYSWQ